MLTLKKHTQLFYVQLSDT